MKTLGAVLPASLIESRLARQNCLNSCPCLDHLLNAILLADSQTALTLSVSLFSIVTSSLSSEVVGFVVLWALALRTRERKQELLEVPQRKIF